MRRFIITIALLILVAIYLARKPQQYSAQGKQDTDTHGQRGLLNTDGTHSTAPQNGADQQTFEWYASPEWVLVIVGAVTAFVIGWQSSETRRAAEATETSAKAAEQGVKIQRVAMQQWVDIENWRGNFRFNTDQLPRLNISFDLINPTALPLTITCVSITPGEPTNKNDEIPLNPREIYTHNFFFELTEEHNRQFSNGSLFLDFIVFVVYLDAFKEQQTKLFGKTCLFNMNDLTFQPYRGILPRIQSNEEEEDTNENPN